MSKFTEIVDSPWVNLSLYAESIPHLLHWDLTYLWILERHRDERPKTWEERIEAWRYLLSAFLMDQLIIEEAQIAPPLIHYTKPFGLESVSWLRINGINRAVGVLSPVVLVRPLPDYQFGLLKEWTAALPDPGAKTPDDLARLLKLAVDNLTEQPDGSFAARLGSCLETEFTLQPIGDTSARSVQYPFLDRLGWNGPGLGANVRSVPIFVKAEGDRAQLWKPYCQGPGCLRLLARAEGDPPVDVQSEVITLTCYCGFVNKLPLSDFLVWFREEKQVVAWRRDGITSSPQKGFPPIPRITGDQLEFQWDPGQLRGEMTRRFLKLRFPDRTVSEKSIDDICYHRIIVPGALTDDYKGLPFRNDWLAAVANIETIHGEVDMQLEQITYRNVRINGLPVDVVRRFSNITFESNPSLHTGVYPNPVEMPPGWKNYRAFAAGSDREKYVIKGAGGRPILPWLVHFDSGPPITFSVETKDGRNGVTFFRALPPDTPTHGAKQLVNVGIDFGTSNTLVYVAPRDSDQTNITDKDFAIKPSRLSENVSWFSEPEPVSQNPVADFLPSASRGQSAVDPYLIPTAIWIGINGVLLRWDDKPPIAGMRENGDFKSNDPATPPLRLAYLRELMFLTLPQIIRQADATGWAVKLNLGFAFPLAFGSDAREQMKDILDDLKEELQTAGCNADCLTISESRACVKAFGSPRANQHFLVADMGGGTLDLALFTTRGSDEEPLMHQIGSLRYAGEHYVKALADSVHEDVWKIRDSISSGDSWREYGGNLAVAKTLERFLAFAFEYIRTMVLAFRQTHENAEIRLVLVGNAWHLADALSAGRKHKKARPLFEGVYKHLVAQLGIPNLELYLKEPLTELQSSKHLVVIGALQNSWSGQGRRDLDLDETELPKLPSGRAMELGGDEREKKRFEWHELVGDGITLEAKYSLGDLRSDSEFFVHEMPPMSDSWRKHLLEQFNRNDIREIPYPTEEQIRVQIEASIQGTPPRVGKGPLQIILEQSWVRKLVRQDN